ncbi:hypothetical protein ACMDCR_18635 [Labrys okinawensis]|uniref:SLOG domain-containing protein n=1 Tax=Labrys okinawensis TaxID=346911 RepID=UPI0039BC2789
MKEGDTIFLSASVPYRTPWAENARASEIEEAIVSLARAVFARGGRLVFGGHPSVSPLIAAVAGEYFPPDPNRKERPIITFQSRLFEDVLPNETTEMVRFGWSTIEWTPALPGKTDGDTAPSLALMRAAMLDVEGKAYKRYKLRPPVAMVAIGGMEGVRDEADAFLVAPMPSSAIWKALRSLDRSRLPPAVGEEVGAVLDRSAPRPVPSPIYLFPSGGGAAERLLTPDALNHNVTEDRHADEKTIFALTAARRKGRIIDAEQQWRSEQKGLPEILLFQPYAAISQWLLDRTAPAG